MQIQPEIQLSKKDHQDVDFFAFFMHATIAFPKNIAYCCSFILFDDSRKFRHGLGFPLEVINALNMNNYLIC